MCTDDNLIWAVKALEKIPNQSSLRTEERAQAGRFNNSGSVALFPEGTLNNFSSRLRN